MTILFVLTLSALMAGEKSYFDNSFYELSEIQNNEVLFNSKSIAAMVYHSQLAPTKDSNLSHLNSKSLDEQGFCADFEMIQNKSFAKCTAFLIDSKHLATAAHCILDTIDCKNHRWVFGLTQKLISPENSLINNSQIYSCKSVEKIKVPFSFSNELAQTDLAVIELDRDVLDKIPLKININSDKLENRVVYSLGHPLGTVMKMSPGKIKGYFNNKNFYTNQISLPGSSGSPVIDIETNSVIGVLSKSVKMLQFNPQLNCTEFLKPNGQILNKEDFYSGATNINKIEKLIDLSN